MGPASAILLGNYKLIRVYENDTSLLFDLVKDIGERRDLTREMPDKVAELDGQLTEYLKSVNAQMPTKNLNFDPSNPPADERTGGNRRKRDRRGRQPQRNHGSGN